VSFSGGSTVYRFLVVSIVVLMLPSSLLAEFLTGEQLQRAISGKTLSGKTAKDGDSWKVRVRSNGRADFSFASGQRSSARWRVNGRRIEFKFPRTGERTCRMIDVGGDGRQRWQDCDTGRTSSYIVEPIFASREPRITASARADVERKLTFEAKALKSGGYRPWGDVRIRMSARGSSVREPLELRAKTTYAVIAACGPHCSHIGLTLRDPNGAVFAQSPDRRDTVIVAGPVSQTGKYEAELTVAECSEPHCPVGIEVLQLKTKK
jgi:hypothetical protein